MKKANILTSDLTTANRLSRKDPFSMIGELFGLWFFFFFFFLSYGLRWAVPVEVYNVLSSSSLWLGDNRGYP